jgi:hypothetical protein
MEAGGRFYCFGARGAARRNEQAQPARGWQALDLCCSPTRLEANKVAREEMPCLPDHIPSEKAALIAAQIKVYKQPGRLRVRVGAQRTQSNSRPSPGLQPHIRLAMTAICWNRWVLHEEHESALPLDEKTP